ncbi:MAG: hypothetical protein KKD92_16205 [Proteobacteria bacterium]|nr:hypothetical protein [Pseudomonadota bacterium]
MNKGIVPISGAIDALTVRDDGLRVINLPVASFGVSKTARNKASFGEFTLRD